MAWFPLLWLHFGLFISLFILEGPESQIQLCHLLMLGAMLFFWKCHGNAGNEVPKSASNIHSLRASSNRKAVCISAPQALLQSSWGREKCIFSLLAWPFTANESEWMTGIFQRVKQFSKVNRKAGAFCLFNFVFLITLVRCRTERTPTKPLLTRTIATLFT